MKEDIIRKRIADLEKKTNKLYDLKQETEDKRDRESDPMEISKHERQIETLQKKIDGYLKEIENLENKLNGQEDDGRKKKIVKELNSIDDREIPFVVAAMNRKEAAALIKEAPSDISSDCNEFKISIKDKLDNQQKIEEWISHYKEERDSWVPHIYPSKNISKIISDIETPVNRYLFNNYQNKPDSSELIQIHVEPYSEEFFGADPSRQCEVWDKIKQSAGVIVIDAISLYHSMIRKTLNNSGVFGDERVSIIVLSPINPCTMHPNNKIELFMRNELPLLMSKVDKNPNSSYKVGVGDHREFQQWLFSTLPNIPSSIENYNKLKSTNQLREWAGKSSKGDDKGAGVSGLVSRF